jgi:uncharacterized protein
MLVQIQTAPLPNGGAEPPARFHLFDTALGSHLLLVNGSRVFTLERSVAAALRSADNPWDMIRDLDLDAPEYIGDIAPQKLPVRSLSLAVAEKCNLACTYCYAHQGAFGGPPQNMSEQTAYKAVDLLFSSASRGERVHLSFLGGEPLANRYVLRRATERASAIASRKGVRAGFSITTNGTLLTPEDAEFFETYGFAVTISLDGFRDTHDAVRRTKAGEPTFDRIMRRVRPLLARQQRMQVSARVTVTPLDFDLSAILNGFLALGFHSVGFSPLLSSSSGSLEMSSEDLKSMLARMISCGKEFERKVGCGERYAFLNMMNAMREIHNGTHRPYPCGAGAGYFGVSAAGALYACHRFVEDPSALFGDVESGPDESRQTAWLSERHVHRQQPCHVCWARYLCGGGCHHEVIHRGRPACDYIRGWLHYCLEAYIRLRHMRPDYFTSYEAPAF